MTAVPNPYNPLQPVEDPALFFGRADVFAFFRQHFVGTAHDRALVLIGRRGLGKSSTLRQLPLDEPYAPCLASLGSVEITHEAALIAALADDIRLALDHAGASTYRLPAWSGEGDQREWFKTEFLSVALAALRIRHLVLMVDDAHLIFDAIDRGALPADFWRYLGDMLAAYDRIDLVLALDAAYENRILTIELFNDPALHIRLGDLSLEDAGRLVREPIADLLRYDEGIVEQILMWAGGHPFLLHSICRLLFRRSEERHHAGPITQNDLNAIHHAALDQADEVFGPLWSRAKPNEQITLHAVADLCAAAPGQYVEFDILHDHLIAEGYTIHKTPLAAALRSLDYEGLVRSHEDQYTLAADLIGAWVAANTSAPPGEAVRPAPADAPHAARLMPIMALLAVVLIVAILGIAALGGVFDSDESDHNQPANGGGPTSTLSLNLEATRQSDFMTQTQRAIPTETPTRTPSPTVTPTPSPTETPSPTPTDTPSATPSPRPTRTPIITPATATPTLIPTNTLRPSPQPTLDPGA